MNYYYFAKIRTATCTYTAEGAANSDREFIEAITSQLNKEWTGLIHKEEYFPAEEQLKREEKI